MKKIHYGTVQSGQQQHPKRTNKKQNSRRDDEIVPTIDLLIERKGIQPKLHLLDNECSEEFKEVMTKNGTKYQLVPPHDHRLNISEKAIQVFNDHFVSVL